jgi:hypothetical protein
MPSDPRQTRQTRRVRREKIVPEQRTALAL